jgi:hypothetical protein
MHYDNVGHTVAVGFKSSRSATTYIGKRIHELASYVQRERLLLDGSVRGGFPKQALTEVDDIISSTKGNVETTIIALQKALDLYEVNIGSTSICHVIQDVNVVS